MNAPAPGSSGLRNTVGSANGISLNIRRASTTSVTSPGCASEPGKAGTTPTTLKGTCQSLAASMMPVSPVAQSVSPAISTGTGPGCFWCTPYGSLPSRSRPASSRPVEPQSAIAAKVSVSTARIGCAPKTGGRVTEFRHTTVDCGSGESGSARGALVRELVGDVDHRPGADGCRDLVVDPLGHPALHGQRVPQHGQPDGDRQRHRRRLAGGGPGPLRRQPERATRPAPTPQPSGGQPQQPQHDQRHRRRQQHGEDDGQRVSRAGPRCWSSSRRPRR